MAIDTRDKLIAALAASQHKDILKTSGPVLTIGNYASLLAAVGNPGAGSLTLGNTPNGAIPTDAFAGAIPITDAGVGKELRLAQIEGVMGQVGTLTLYDRLWHGGSYLLTPLGATAVAPPALTRPDANGEDTELWVEINVAPAAASTINVTYTNSAGATGKTTGATASLSGFASGRMFPLPFAAGDVGIRAVTSITVGGTAGAGSYNLVILRKLAKLRVIAPSVGDVLDFARVGFPKVFNDSCLMAYLLPGSATWPNPSLDIQLAVEQ